MHCVAYAHLVMETGKSSYSHVELLCGFSIVYAVSFFLS